MIGYVEVPHRGTCSLCGQSGDMWALTRAASHNKICNVHDDSCPQDCPSWEKLLGAKCVNETNCKPEKLDAWLREFW